MQAEWVRHAMRDGPTAPPAGLAPEFRPAPSPREDVAWPTASPRCRAANPSTPSRDLRPPPVGSH